MNDTITVENTILTAARKLFVTKGFESTRMQDVADYSGININMLNYYYRNKQCLFDSVFEKAFITFLPNVVDVLVSSIPFREKIEKIIDGYLEIIKENPYFSDFLFNELKRNPERLADNLRKKGLDVDKVNEVLKKEADNGTIKYIKAEHLICNILSLVFMPFVAWPLIKSLLYQNNEEAYLSFVEERKSVIKDIIVSSVEI